MRRDQDTPEASDAEPEVEFSVAAEDGRLMPVPPGRDAPTRTGRGGIAAIVAIVLVGTIGGFIVGDRAGRASVPPAAKATPGPSTSGLVFADAITMTGQRCSIQVGTRLELGAEFLNSSTTTPADVRDIDIVLPNGGLSVRSERWGACGLLSEGAPPLVRPRVIPPGGSAWYSIVVNVEIVCPAPIPVEFKLTYAMGRELDTRLLNPFPDLVDVSWTGCPAYTQN